MKRALPTDSEERKSYPMMRGCLLYFPAALAGVARTSLKGNEKHNAGEEMHHAREKSTDHGDCIIRHLHDTEELVAAFERGPEVIDTQAVLDEASQLCWRALAYSQELHERLGNAPLAPRARKPDSANALSGLYVMTKTETAEAKAYLDRFNSGHRKAAGPADVDADGGTVLSKRNCRCGADLSVEPHKAGCQR